MFYEFKRFRELPENKELTFESVWVRYNDLADMEHHELSRSMGGYNYDNTLNEFVENDFVEDFIV